VLEGATGVRTNEGVDLTASERISAGPKRLKRVHVLCMFVARTTLLTTLS